MNSSPSLVNRFTFSWDGVHEMKRYVLVFAVFLLLVANPLQAADFGFGIPDMVEEKVEELDQEVREFKANQPLLDELRETLVAVSGDTRDKVVDATITEGEFKNLVYVVLDVNRPGNEGIGLFESDGEGKVLASELFDGENVSHEQISISLDNNFVDILLTINTDTGPASILSRRQVNNGLSRPGAGIGDVVIGSTASQLGKTDTAVKVSTFSYDQTEENIYVSGDSGVFKVLTATSGDVLPNAWNSKFQEEFNVPSSNLIVSEDTVYVTALEPYSVSNQNIQLKKIASDSTVARVDTYVQDVVNPQVSLVGDKKFLYLHYFKEGISSDTIFKIRKSDLQAADTTSVTLASHFHLKFEKENQLIAEGVEGEIYRFDKSAPTNNESLTTSDTRATIVLEGNMDELFGGTLDSEEATIFSVFSNFTNTSDTSTVFPSSGDIIEQGVCQPGNIAEDAQPFMSRPVWIKKGFLGFVFGGTCIGWTDEGVSSSRLNLDAPWPHEDANNQRQRQPQN
jgi:hypothetical protein